MENEIINFSVTYSPYIFFTCDLIAEDHHEGSDHEGSDHENHSAERFVHFHFSHLKSPIVHTFGVEPAFTGRDLFFTYRFRDTGGNASEHEMETEIEWAFTRRAGVILEMPQVFENSPGVPGRNGFGDLVIVPRVNVIEKDRFFLTTQVAVTTPSGTNGFGGETAIAPGVNTWCDLCNWWTVNSMLAVEHNFSNDSNAFVFGFGLVKTFGTPDILTKDEHGHITGAGLLSLLMEATGTVGLSGDDSGRVEAEALLGCVYGLGPHCGLRAGYQFPISSPRAFSGGVVVGIIKHL